MMVARISVLLPWSTGACAYSSSVTCSPQATGLPVSSACWIAMWVMKRVGRGAVPVVLAGLEEDAVAGSDQLDAAALALAEPDTLGDPDRLAERVRVPRGAGARGEMDGSRADARVVASRSDRVDIDRAGEPVGGADPGLERIPGDLHGSPSRRRGALRTTKEECRSSPRQLERVVPGNNLLGRSLPPRSRTRRRQ